MEYSLTINETPFTIDDENLDYTDLILKSAPVFYLYKFHEDKSMYEQLSEYSKCSIYCNYIFHDLSVLKDDSFLSLFYEEDFNRKLLDFLFIIKQLLLKKPEDGNYIDRINELNLWDSFGKYRRLYGYISDIVFSCNTYIIKRDQELYYHILDIIRKLLNNCKKQLFDVITRITLYINTNDSKSDDIGNVLPEFLFRREVKNKVISDLEKIIQNNLNLLSSFPSTSINYINKLTSMINTAINIDFDIFNERCMAIIEDNTGVYFSFSNKQDYIYNKSFFQKERDYAKEINQKLFKNNAKWCYLSGRTKNYLKLSTYSKTHYEYIDISPYFELIKKEKNQKNWHFYSCCERKILGMHTKISNFNLYVMLSPCERCAKPLFEFHYNKIYSLLEYKKGWKKEYMNSFNVREYTIDLENQKYICKEKV